MADPSAGPLVADDDISDEIDNVDAAGSDNTSLRSTILDYRKENGRTYHTFKDGSYALPNDEIENERLDLQHHVFTLTFDGKLHIAPLPKPPAHVLDVGTGMGIWAIDFGKPSIPPKALTALVITLQIVGVDLSPIQPLFVPPNVSFFVDDLEDEWNFPQNFDYVFARFMTGSILDWPKFFKQSFDSLNPGGFIELQDIIYPMRSDDGTLTEDSALHKWSVTLAEDFRAAGRRLDSALEYEAQLAEAGFVDIVRVPYKWPTNRWPRDAKYKEVGIWANENALTALHALSLAIFTRPKGEGGLGWTVPELEALLDSVRKDMSNTRIHAYWLIDVIYAKKPE
ncbi:S-adenosyl-L-methionine-dependent methyltransferase [Podospora appendiculata]|uniref:S-adenosyl-L-methionine-dependent methyltransferase n=1 Tax=Podospora appendiculata TaxID=314037 RepID=A0AAE0X012_9PEZI|nr:S-adenosyl-L-methionine-dependent methyltransferase [Podospora appendiculata]